MKWYFLLEDGQKGGPFDSEVKAIEAGRESAKKREHKTFKTYESHTPGGKTHDVVLPN